MEVERWNEIMSKFQTKFGWERGMNLMLKYTRKIMFMKFVPDLNKREEKHLVDALRKVYRENE